MDGVMEEGTFIIQYSHDDVKWFGYGADVITPPTQFNEVDGNAEYERVLAKWHSPYPASFVRLADLNGIVMRHDTLSVMRGRL